VKGFGLTEAYQLQDYAGQLAERAGITEGLVGVFATVEPCRTFSLRWRKGRPSSNRRGGRASSPSGSRRGFRWRCRSTVNGHRVWSSLHERLGQTPGPALPLFMNFMDDVDDDAMYMFTKGQVVRMHVGRTPKGASCEGKSWAFLARSLQIWPSMLACPSHSTS
jgi:hypothetical protein